MGTSNTLLKYKQLIGIAVAGIILTVIFVPFQKAEAFTVNLALPNTTGNQAQQSNFGEDFTITVNVSPGELVTASSIDIIVDNTQATAKRATFSSAGALTSGSGGIIIGNLTITQTSTGSGYGYGYGTVASGISGYGYSYSFTGLTTGFLGGNTAGSSNPATNPIVGVVGPGKITIHGKLNTALLSAGSHTIDAVINTGAGGNGADKMVAPQLIFTVNANSHITTGSVNQGTNSTTSIIASDGKTVGLRFDFVQSFAHFSIEDLLPGFLRSIYSSIFNVIGSSASSFGVGSSTAITAGTIYDIDISSITHTGFIYVTIHYDPNLLPAGMSENDVKFFHWTGTAWEDATVSVDTAANTVTGKLTSLSPVVAGYYSSSSSSTTTTTSVGSGGGGGSVILNGSFPPDYFNANPLAKLQIQNSSFKNLAGTTLFGAKVGQQVSISATFKNYQQVAQNYAIIIQVVDQNGFTTDTGWVTGIVDAGQTVDNARSWTPDAAGNYTIKIFVWDNVSSSPVPLSETTTKYFSASE